MLFLQTKKLKMTKKLLLFLMTFCSVVYVSAQAQETLSDTRIMDRSSGVLFKQGLVTEDKSETFTITGIGNNVTFSASNYSDGTANSFNHLQKVTLPITVTYNTPIKVQLVFYAPGDKIPHTAMWTNEGVTVFYNMDFYDEIKKRLSDALAAKKKVQLQVIIKKDGYREASLLF